MKIQSFVLLLCALAVGLSATACGGSSVAPTSLTSVTVTGAAPAVGSTSQFTATETLSNGAVADVTSSAAWSSSDTAVATVSPSGLVTSMASGPVVISASYSGVAGSESITVP